MQFAILSKKSHNDKKATTEHAMIAFWVGVAGLEPTTSASRTQHSTN
jgi:hypothetical protein